MTNARTWRLRDVAAAVQMQPRALRQCFEIGALKLSGEDVRSSGSGHFVRLSKPRAYQAGTMKQLHRLGLSIPHAARMAFTFSDEGNIGRKPGELFDHGMTILSVDQNGATVKNLFSFSEATGACVAFVRMNEIVDQVNIALDNISKKAT